MMFETVLHYIRVTTRDCNHRQEHSDSRFPAETEVLFF